MTDVDLLIFVGVLLFAKMYPFLVIIVSDIFEAILRGSGRRKDVTNDSEFDCYSI